MTVWVVTWQMRDWSSGVAVFSTRAKAEAFVLNAADVDRLKDVERALALLTDRGHTFELSEETVDGAAEEEA